MSNVVKFTMNNVPDGLDSMYVRVEEDVLTQGVRNVLYSGVAPVSGNAIEVNIGENGVVGNGAIVSADNYTSGGAAFKAMSGYSLIEAGESNYDNILIINNGQSLSIGDKGYPLTHETPSFGDSIQMFSGLPPIGAGYEIGLDDSDLESLVEFKEQSKETHAWSMLNWMNSRSTLSDVIYSSLGVGGKTISELTDVIQNQVWGWNNTKKVIDKVKSLGTFDMPFTTWIHGEANSVNLDPDAYKSDLREYHDRLKSESDKNPFMAIDQTGKSGSIDIASTLLDYSEENPDCVMAGPKYWLNRLYPEVGNPSIRLHLDAYGYMLQGEMLGECITQKLDGVDFKPLSPSSISIVPNSNYKQVKIDFNVPSGGNLVIDDTTLPSCPGLGLALNYLSTYSNIPASSYTVNANSITFTFDEYITTEGLVSLGGTLDDRVNTDNVLLPCTNIRSDIEHNSMAVTGVKWYDWACQFKRHVEGALDRQSDNLWRHGDFIGVIAASEIVIGRTAEWLLVGLGDVTVSCNVTTVSGSAWIWVHNTRVILQNGYNEVIVPANATNRMYLQGSSSGFEGSIENINIRVTP